MSLQDVLDAEYGPGVVDVNSYFGSNPIDPEVPYWFDSNIGGLLVTEIAGFEGNNTMGWYVEDGSMPVIDGVDDGVIFLGGHTDGSSASVNLPRQCSSASGSIRTAPTTRTTHRRARSSTPTASTTTSARAGTARPSTAPATAIRRH